MRDGGCRGARRLNSTMRCRRCSSRSGGSITYRYTNTETPKTEPGETRPRERTCFSRDRLDVAHVEPHAGLRCEKTNRAPANRQAEQILVDRRKAQDVVRPRLKQSQTPNQIRPE